MNNFTPWPARSEQNNGTVIAEFNNLAGLPCVAFELDEPKGVIQVLAYDQVTSRDMEKTTRDDRGRMTLDSVDRAIRLLQNCIRYSTVLVNSGTTNLYGELTIVASSLADVKDNIAALIAERDAGYETLGCN